MKTNRITFTAVFVGIALLASSLLFAAFRIGMDYHVNNNATEAIEEVIRWFEDPEYISQTDESTRLYAIMFYVEDIEFSKENGIIEDYYYENEYKIMQWVKKHAEPEEIYRIRINNKEFFVEYTDRLEGPAIVYVDTTPEYNLIHNISLILLFVLFLAILGAGSAGFVFGTRIEKDRKQQKEFFENASHELKTPLMVIDGYSDGIAKGMVPVETGTSIIHQEVDKMTSLVNEILSISRLESGATVLHKEDISLQELIENSLYPLEYQAQRKGIKVESRIEDTLISADPVQMDKAISNLFNNALRYADTTIQIDADQRGIRIRNDGPCPNEETLKHMFDRFYTGENGNTGIGLALTKEIVQKHGWKIQAKTVSGMVEFYIQF